MVRWWLGGQGATRTFCSAAAIGDSVDLCTHDESRVARVSLIAFKCRRRSVRKPTLALLSLSHSLSSSLSSSKYIFVPKRSHAYIILYCVYRLQYFSLHLDNGIRIIILIKIIIMNMIKSTFKCSWRRRDDMFVSYGQGYRLSFEYNTL